MLFATLSMLLSVSYRMFCIIQSNQYLKEQRIENKLFVKFCVWIILNLYSNLFLFYFWNVIICLVDPNPPKLRLKWKRYVEYTRKKRRRRKLKLKLKFSKDQSYGRKQSHAPSEKRNPRFVAGWASRESLGEESEGNRRGEGEKQTVSLSPWANFKVA